jgi:ribosomal protein L16 Arg81 hydroxylase
VNARQAQEQAKRENRKGQQIVMSFDQIVSPLGTDTFLRDYWLKTFVHIPGKAGRFTDLVTWTELNAILEQHRLMPPRLKLFKDGQAIDPAHYLTPAMFGVPRLDAGGLALCLAQGASLILDDAQELAPRVQELMQFFQDALHTDTFTNLYAGWHSQKAFDMHWDPQEAIVLQLSGKKRWKVYRPTRLHPLKNDVEAPQQPAGEPVWEGIMADGDVLYIPRGWWHVAFPLNEPSLHLTVSLTPPTGMDYLGWVVSKLRHHAGARASLAPDAAARSTDDISKLLAGLVNAQSVSDFLGEWDANIRPSPHIRLPNAPYEQLSAVTDDSRIRLASLHRLSFTTRGENFEFIAGGRLWTVPKSLQPALAKLHNAHAFTVAELAAALSAPSAKADLFKSLNVLAGAGVVLVEKS